MAVNIETATLEDYRNMMLRPTKLNEIAQVLYDLAQCSCSGNLAERVTFIEERLVLFEEEIDNLRERIEALENA